VTAPISEATKKGTLMPNVPPANDSDPDPYRLDGPHITPLFTQILEEEAARRGLPPEPWAA
jgi:hypothetical protein